MPSWHLINADEIAAEHKYTFYKPSAGIIEQVVSGEVVKLIFEFESEDPNAPRAERMWVLVDEVSGQGRFKGRLNNEPKYIVDLKLDDPVEFEACHIINTEHDDDDNIVERYIKRCFVTNRVLNEGYKVGYLYREEPDEEKDSGWRITSNTESDEYTDNTENVAYVSLGAVLSRDDSFLNLLEQPVGSAFIRNASTNEFVSLSPEG
ncbi:DUF2185 domain-containing protein [Chitinivorax sp. PXF-14]|uniref:immunity protein Imm33 domain-containing protein n=1 Tax=Chitinivorax sp. PXF-14 TaxID=3230488 RepID=UPI003466CD97